MLCLWASLDFCITSMEFVGETILGYLLLAGEGLLKKLSLDTLELAVLVQCQPKAPWRQINPSKTYEIHLVHCHV